MADKSEQACISCGNVGPAVYKRRFSIILAVFLFCFGFFPGMLYILIVFVVRKANPVCPLCNRATLVPAASPQGIRIKEQFGKATMAAAS